MDSVPRLGASEDSPWLLDMADHVERAGTYALVYLAVVQHWNAVCPDEWHVRQIIPNPKATWAFARAFLRAPAKKRKRSLEGHVKSNQRDRDRAQRRQAAKGQKGQTGWAGKGEGEKGEYSYWR